MTTSDLMTEESTAADSKPIFSRLDLALMVAVLLFYSITRLIAIEEFPIYFFCDEATQANYAQELVDHDFRDNEGTLFPAYFRNAKVFNLGLSVWIHAPTTVLFGKSITVVRATSMAIGLLGAAALMLALKFGFRSRLWWIGGLVFGALPGWFLHSRTAFETAMMVGFYAAFVLTYVLYREISPRWLPAAIVFGAATFYSYSNGQGVMFVTGLLLLLTDWRYHWQVLRNHRGVVVAAIVTAILMAGPYVRFRFVLHPEMMEAHFDDLHSYWIEDIPIGEKTGTFFRTYVRGLSPCYWFFDDTDEAVRHRMLGYGHLPLWLSPAILLGVGVAVWKGRRSAIHRLVLIAVLAAPFSASMVDIRITRVLSMMVPATVLAVLGLDCLRHWLRRFVPDRAFTTVAAGGLIVATSLMTADALTNGATWFRDYGIGGMQWGARQLYDELRKALVNDSEIRFIVSHSWANWPDAFPVFFLGEPMCHRVRMEVIEEYLIDYRPLEMSPKQLFVMTSGEYETARNSPMLDVSEPLRVISYPDGKPGFVIVRVDYSSDALQIFETEQAERRTSVQTTINLDGSEVHVVHPKFDFGTLESLFDGDLKSIARTLDADPCVIIFRFNEEKPISGVRLTLWTRRYDLRIRVVGANGEVAQAAAEVDTGRDFGVFELRVPTAIPAAREIAVTIDKHGDNRVHIQEIEFLPGPDHIR